MKKKKNLEIWKIGYRIDQFEEKKMFSKECCIVFSVDVEVLIEQKTTLDLLV